MANKSSESEFKDAGNSGALQKELEAYKSMKKLSSDDCVLQWLKISKNTFHCWPMLEKCSYCWLQ
uniref:Uncharacterized protein n=1 Tax=Romanomermis culicivorax TaxID=13658 RepID=A0A915LAW8_ROMCU